MVTATAAADATEIDVNDLVNASTGSRYIGKATKTFGGRWRCLASVGGALCIVALTVRPTVHVDSDPGDEDDRAARDVRRDRDLKRPRSCPR